MANHSRPLWGRPPPPQMPPGCGVLFFGVFLLGGVGGLVGLVFGMVVPEWRVNHRFVEGRCVVLGKRLGESNGEDGPVYRPEIHVRYTADGRPHEAWTYDVHGSYSSGKAHHEAVLRNFTVGGQYPCWYDPGRPDRVVLVRGHHRGTYAMLLVPLVFCTVGAVGVGHAVRKMLRPGAVEEARLAKRLAKGAAAVATDEYPTVPETDRKDSPGTVLAVRLPARLTPGQVLRYEGIGLLVLGTVVAGFAWGLFGAVGLQARPPALFLGLIAGILGAAWLVLLLFFLRQWRLVRAVGPTVVEVSAFPLVAGEPARLYLSQVGPLRVEYLHVTLVCEESATYRQGTDTRTEKRCVFRGDVHRAARFAIEQDRPYEGRFELAVPRTAMHSFEAAHNEVRWKLVVEAELAGLPAYRQEYPLVVRPPLR